MKRTTRVAYSDYLPYFNNRPYASVQLVNGPRTSSVFTCLVDTGADYLLLPSSAAASVRLALPRRTVSIGTVGGSISVHQVSGCTVEIEGVSVPVTVLFDPSGNLPLVLGREAIMACCECGFNTQEWLWV